MTQHDKTMVAIDGSDALAFVIIRPGSIDGAVSIETGGSGISKAAVAYILRNLAARYEREAVLDES